MTPGTDNAFFATMADGINGQLRLYVFDYTSPRRDGALENDVVVHEVRHFLFRFVLARSEAEFDQ